MALTKYALGELIQPYVRVCGVANLSPDVVSGINRDKEFFEPARQIGADTSGYKVVPPGYFACNLMHVGRDYVLPIAMNHTEREKIVTSAYTVFCISQNAPVIREYFYFFLKSNEKDRFFWFHADSSVRDGITWNAFCEMELELPSLPIQQKYVDIYKSMIANQRSYERGLDDLKLVRDGYIDKIKRSSPMKPVGELLREIDVRNDSGAVDNVQGINIAKQFMPSVADTNGVNLRNYKVVQKGQFAFSGMQTGRDECIRIALYTGNNPIIISPAYSVFEVKDSAVLSAYIMMWFSRAEADRRGWFMSDSSIRTNLDLERFYEIMLPISDIGMQKSVVKLYSAYLIRKNISEKLKAQIKAICPVLIKGSLEEGQADHGGK